VRFWDGTSQERAGRRRNEKDAASAKRLNG
jgi:hypothetical protein